MKTRVASWAFVGLCGAVALTLGGCGGIIDEQAEQSLRNKIGQTSMTVFPAFIRDGEEKRYDRDAAKEIGDFLTQENIATVTVSDAEVHITSQWGMDQAKMFRGSAADFSAYVKTQPIETDYALLAEYLIGGRGTVVGVHLYLLDANGTVAYAALFNSHHKEFNDVNPKTADDATLIVINRLRSEFAPSAAAKSVPRPSVSRAMGRPLRSASRAA